MNWSRNPIRINLLRFVHALPDRRSAIGFTRLVIVIITGAVTAGADGPTAKRAEPNETWLRKHSTLPYWAPGNDTFARVLGALNPAKSQQCTQERPVSLRANDNELEWK